jgi:hypothetical protein
MVSPKSGFQALGPGCWLAMPATSPNPRRFHPPIPSPRFPAVHRARACAGSRTPHAGAPAAGPSVSIRPPYMPLSAKSAGPGRQPPAIPGNAAASSWSLVPGGGGHGHGLLATLARSVAGARSAHPRSSSSSWFTSQADSRGSSRTN